MKKIVLLVLGIGFLISAVSAYQVTVYAPGSLTIGLPLVVNGTTTFGIGTPIDVVLYQQVTTSTEIDRQIAYVQEDHSFRVVFDTTRLPPGTYKVEVPASGTGDSITMRQVLLVDRSADLVLTSQTTQALSDSLYLSGQIAVDAGSGVQVAVIGPDNGVVFGPTFVSTDSMGRFSLVVPISQPGNYDMSFTDARGYITTQTVTIIGETATITPGQTTAANILSAHGKSSRDNPIYFIVQPSGNGPVTVFTSASVDWVVEYVDAEGNLQTVNDQGGSVPDMIVLQESDKPLYFKVYPYKYSVTDDVTLTAENAASIAVSPEVPGGFTAAQASQAETTTSPVPAILCIIATGTAVLVIHRKKT
ncbi:hypothetical protein [Methanoregula sp.]|uniref:hypothetical protein n=1 Tax=Methanoregula sp. TaxID=2052170 RepID=UPI002C13AACA|nr:hypothetical protein [Methanoregula sp.]HVP95841.1 hypothetical protein [Methanoregula sp.]